MAENCSLEHVELWEGNIFQNEAAFLVFLVYFILVCLTSICGNVVILSAIFRSKKLQKRRNILIFNLAATDLSAGLIYPYMVVFGTSYVDAIGFANGMTSIFTIIAIAAERFLKLVVFPLNNSNICTNRQLIGVVIFFWLTPISITSSIFFTDRLLHHVVFYTIGSLFIVSVMAGISFFYAAIIWKMRQHDKKMMDTYQRRKYDKTVLVLKAYVIIVVMYAVCWLPWAIECLRIIFSTYFGVAKEDRCLEASSFTYFTVAMLLLNPAVNPVIYWKRLPDFRHSIQELFMCCPYVKSSSASTRTWTTSVGTELSMPRPTQEAYV